MLAKNSGIRYFYMALDLVFVGGFLLEYQNLKFHFADSTNATYSVHVELIVWRDDHPQSYLSYS